ncbi:MAG: permease [Candidatus Omnitrophica bacterium]|nr:permease [Candidatus Omnitrophota bacterium]
MSHAHYYWSAFTCVCSTASVPLADAFIRSGLSSGQAMTFLLVCPITSCGTIFVLKKEFGVRILTIYLLSISALSLIFGMSFTVFF